MEKHKIIESKTMFNGNVFEAKVENIILPNGKQAMREVIIHRGGASVVAIYKNNFVLVRQYRHAAQSYVLEIPAGIVEHGESPITCAERELKEETGFSTSNISHLITMYKSIGYNTEKHSIFLAQDLTEGKQNLDPDEDIDIHLIPINDVIKMIFSGEIYDSKTIAGVLAYREKYRS